MPESKVRKEAADKKRAKHEHELAERRAEKDGIALRSGATTIDNDVRKADARLKAASADEAHKPAGKKSDGKKGKTAKVAKKKVQRPRNWVPYVFVPVGLLGVLWLVTYYIAGSQIPIMAALGDWNILIGMGLMAASFVIATLWK